MLKKSLTIAVVLLLSNLFSTEKLVWPGYGDFRFFSTIDEVKKQLTSTNTYLAKGAPLTEQKKELFLLDYIDQDFVYFDNSANKYFQFHFTSNVPALKLTEPKKLYHLTERFNEDFQFLVSPASPEKKDKEWEHKFFFYNHKKEAMRLFGISISFRGGDKYGDEFYVMQNYMFKDLLTKINKTFGSPTHKGLNKLDEFTEKHYITFTSGYTQTVPKFNINVNCIVTWTTFSGRICNYQVTYITSDYFSEYTLKHLANTVYRDIKSDQLIDF